MSEIFKYKSIIAKISDNLFKDINTYDVDLFEKFFIERIEEAEQLSSILSEINNYGGNVLVVGEPGIGKSIFFKWFLEKSFFAKMNIKSNYELIDLRGENLSKEFIIPNFQKRLIRILRYCIVNRFKDKCHDFPNAKSFNEQYIYCINKIQEIKVKDKHSDLVTYIFVDDVDYLDEKIFAELLEYLRPLLHSQFFCVIIACRIPAFNSINSHKDFNITASFGELSTIKLTPLPVHKILTARIDTLIKEGNTIKTILKSPTFLAYSFKEFLKFLKSETDLMEDDIPIFKYPFTAKQHYFMRKISNGNIRIVLKLAKEYLKYMSENRNTITEGKDGYVIGRIGVISHFTRPDIEEKLRVINIHNKKTHQYTSKADIKKREIDSNHIENSINLIMLETYQLFQTPNTISSQYFEEIKLKYGLTQLEIDEGREFLIDHDLIRQRMYKLNTPIGSEIGKKDFDLTEKGEYYLSYLIHWEDYIEKFGMSNHQKNYREPTTMLRIEIALLNFSINIYELYKTDKGDLDFKVSKELYTKLFNEINEDLIRTLNNTDKITLFEFRTHDIQFYLAERLKIIEIHNINSEKNFYFISEKLIDVAKRMNQDMKLKYIYNETRFLDFVQNNVKKPESKS